jgi:hypothetical protein
MILVLWELNCFIFSLPSPCIIFSCIDVNCHWSLLDNVIYSSTIIEVREGCFSLFNLQVAVVCAIHQLELSIWYPIIIGQNWTLRLLDWSYICPRVDDSAETEQNKSETIKNQETLLYLILICERVDYITFKVSFDIQPVASLPPWFWLFSVCRNN